MKKVFSVVLALLAIVTFIPVAFASDADITAFVGEDLQTVELGDSGVTLNIPISFYDELADDTAEQTEEKADTAAEETDLMRLVSDKCALVYHITNEEKAEGATLDDFTKAAAAEEGVDASMVFVQEKNGVMNGTYFSVDFQKLIIVLDAEDHFVKVVVEMPTDNDMLLASMVLETIAKAETDTTDTAAEAAA